MALILGPRCGWVFNDGKLICKLNKAENPHYIIYLLYARDELLNDLERMKTKSDENEILRLCKKNILRNADLHYKSNPNLIHYAKEVIINSEILKSFLDISFLPSQEFVDNFCAYTIKWFKFIVRHRRKGLQEYYDYFY